ncbi:ParA family protein [Candidatus Dojkabacteria bacterium]|uniref:ParA family protein n=1 Tax=Candidatus Dojkabacteria bacterium TaxID=2099670 RepID=A0A955L8J1_9BACT|nr:ParA family protein [Candidatus Dojkabacteria bacterium]
MIVAFANQKGGVGKTTTTLNLGSYLAALGKKTCLIDLDPQANLTSGLGYSAQSLTENDSLAGSVYDLLTSQKEFNEVLFQTRSDNLTLIPSSIDLAGAEIELVNMVSRETILRDALEKAHHVFDFVLIDCPPSLGLLTINALTAADRVCIPVQTEYFALEGLGQLLNTVKLVKSKLNSNLKIGGVIMTMFDARTNLAKDVISEVHKVFGDRVFETIIPRNIRLSEAPSHGKSIVEYDSNSSGADAYKKLAEEFITSFSK